MSTHVGSGPLAPEEELEARSTFLELLAGFVGALGAGVAGSFGSDPTVPDHLAAILFVLGCLLWVGVTVLSALTWGRIKALRGGAPSAQRRFGTGWSGWTVIVVGTTILVLALSTVVYWLGQRPDPDYSSSYDGLDPKLTQCDDSATVVIPGSSTDLLDLGGARVGKVQLKSSPACGTVWADVLVDAEARTRLKGQIVHVEMFRRGDGKSVIYPLLLKGGPEGWSNMISAVASCAEARVYLMEGNNGTRVGPPTSTSCELERA